MQACMRKWENEKMKKYENEKMRKVGNENDNTILLGCRTLTTGWGRWL